MNEYQPNDIVLPEGAVVLKDRPPFEPSIALAVEVARLGVSDEAIEALGGEEALRIVRGERSEPTDDGGSNGLPRVETDGQ